MEESRGLIVTNQLDRSDAFDTGSFPVSERATNGQGELQSARAIADYGLGDAVRTHGSSRSDLPEDQRVRGPQ